MLNRRDVMGGFGGAALTATLSGRAFAALPLPKNPVTITIVDVA